LSLNVPRYLQEGGEARIANVGFATNHGGMDVPHQGSFWVEKNDAFLLRTTFLSIFGWAVDYKSSIVGFCKSRQNLWSLVDFGSPII